MQASLHWTRNKLLAFAGGVISNRMNIRILFLILVFSRCVFAAEAPSFFDSGVNGLELESSKSGKRILAESNAECGASFEFGYCFMNPAGSETIVLSIHPGSTKYSVAEIEIQHSSEKANLPEYPERIEKFETSKGVRLGISVEELISLLGRPAKTENEAVYYRIEDNEYLLEEYNMPIYYGQYRFKDNKLVEFKYGFEYP